MRGASRWPTWRLTGNHLGRVPRDENTGPAQHALTNRPKVQDPIQADRDRARARLAVDLEMQRGLGRVVKVEPARDEVKRIGLESVRLARYLPRHHGEWGNGPGHRGLADFCLGCLELSLPR